MNIVPTGKKIMVSLNGEMDSDEESGESMMDDMVRATVMSLGPEFGKKSKEHPMGMESCCADPDISEGDEVICRCCEADVFTEDGKRCAFVYPDQIQGVVGKKSAKKLSKLVGQEKSDSKSSEAEPDDDDAYGEETEMDE